MAKDTCYGSDERHSGRGGPHRVVLFGSHARGTATSDSDVDLLARRPDDTQRGYAQGDPLIREALDQGRVLYVRK
jgi:predicted nucleotidyltransferase